MSINLGAPKSNDDEYYTPQYAIEMLKDYLPDKKKSLLGMFYIWKPRIYRKSKLYKIPWI
jgi:hypothetical protein